VTSFAHSLYGQLFNDEAHLLLVFFEHGAWPNNITHIYAVPGNMARSVMDREALDILLDFVQLYYYQDITEEAMFSNAFNQAAQRIMFVPPDNRSIWITIIIVVGVVLLVVILFSWWRRKQEQNNIEAAQTERILSQSLDSFGGDDEASRLAQRYDDNQDGS
jgi:nitrogen fixation-related uncharacterized protein